MNDGVREVAAEEWAVGGDDDVVLGAVLDDWALLAERVELYGGGM